MTTATGGQKSLQIFGADPSLGSNMRESVGITASSDLTFDSKFRSRSQSGCSNHARCTHHDENRNLTVWAICPEYNVAHSANCHFLHNKSSFLLCMGTSVSLHGVELLSAHRGTAWCDRLRFLSSSRLLASAQTDEMLRHDAIVYCSGHHSAPNDNQQGRHR